MTDSGLTQKQEDLLVYVVNNKIQRVKPKHADDIFDTEEHAKKALRSLASAGFVKADKSVAAPVFILQGFPEEIDYRINEEILEMVK